MSERAMIRAFMASLIEKAGGMEAAAALIGARLGSDISKGTVSKRQAGHLDWPLVEIMALEDVIGDRCVRRWLSRSDPERAEAEELLDILADAGRESGEAWSAIVRYASGHGSLAEARKELEDAIAQKERLRAHLDSRGA